MFAGLKKKGFPAGELGDLMRTLYEIKVNGLEYLLQPLREPSRKRGHYDARS